MQRPILFLALAAATLALASTASAYPSLAFNRAAAAPGDRVAIFTANGQAKPEQFLPREGGLLFVVYLAPASLGHKLDRKRTIAGRRVALVGELKADDGGVGRLKFRVPDLPPGLYAARMWCSSCGSILPDHKPTNHVAGLGVLRITAARSGGRTSTEKSAAAAGVVALLAVGAGLLRGRRRSS